MKWNNKKANFIKLKQIEHGLVPCISSNTLMGKLINKTCCFFLLHIWLEYIKYINFKYHHKFLLDQKDKKL